MGQKFKTDAFEAIHSAAADLRASGLITRATLKEVDAACLMPPRLTPAEIKQLRLANQVSQPVFARYLNTSESTVEKWETGAKKPSAMASKLLSLVQKHGLQILG